MASTPKILGQVAPSANTLTTLYTVPAATKTTVSSIIVCNRSASSFTFRISAAVAGAADATKQYLYYDVTIEGNDTFIATVGITLGATDVLRVYANTTNLSFTAYGIENA